jgi:hypothetical protein
MVVGMTCFLGPLIASLGFGRDCGFLVSRKCFSCEWDVGLTTFTSRVPRGTGLLVAEALIRPTAEEGCGDSSLEIFNL